MLFVLVLGYKDNRKLYHTTVHLAKKLWIFQKKLWPNESIKKDMPDNQAHPVFMI